MQEGADCWMSPAQIVYQFQGKSPGKSARHSEVLQFLLRWPVILSTLSSLLFARSSMMLTRRPSHSEEVVEYNLRIDRQRGRFFKWAFVFVVLIPTVASAGYYGLVASDRFVSEAQYVVRGVSTQRANGIDILFRTFGISRAVDDTNAVQNYLLSRDAVHALEAKVPLRRIFSSASADGAARFPRPWRDDSFESLYDYYRDRVHIVTNSKTGISELSVVTFQPEDSVMIATALLRTAEEMVNRLNDRARKDLVDSARREVEYSEAALFEVQRRLTIYRNAELVVDPKKNSAAILDTMGVLTKELAQASARLSEVEATTPQSPMRQGLRAQMASLQQQIAEHRLLLAGDDKALATNLSTYERLTLERELADSRLGAATTAYLAAQQEAQRKKIYIERIVSPNLPDESTDPRRLRAVATVFTVCITFFAVMWIILVGAKEHAQ